jgi:hypothetical protein
MWVSRCSSVLLAILCSSSLQHVLVSDTGQKLVGSWREHFLYITVTFAWRQSLDTVPHSTRDFLKMTAWMGLSRRHTPLVANILCGCLSTVEVLEKFLDPIYSPVISVVSVYEWLAGHVASSGFSYINTDSYWRFSIFLIKGIIKECWEYWRNYNY